MSRRLLAAATFIVALILGAAPVLATHTSDHAAEQIQAVVVSAEADMDRVVAGFQHQTSSVETSDEVAAAESSALEAVEGIWTAAKGSIEEKVVLYPGELGQLGGSAKQQIQDARQASRTLISDLALSWAPPPAPTTTSTTVPTTTTTSEPATQDRSADPPPSTDNGSGPSAAPGASGLPRPGSPAPRVEPFAPLQPSDKPVVGFIPLLTALMPGAPVAFGFGSDSDAVESRGSGPTDTMAHLLETVLPPALVDLVLSPLLILEILIRIILDGGARMIAPIALLLASAYGIFKYERSTRRRAADGADPGLLA